VWISPEGYKIVGKCLATTRKRAGMSQDELAVLLEKPQSFVSAYERGQRRIDLLEFLKIMGTLKADPREVFANIVTAYRAHR
jgi:transcriptional regulator with XRE-family HTH domain